MSPRALLLVWLSLIVLVGVEVLAARLAGGGLLPVLVGLGMALVVLLTFMNLRAAPTLGIVFAAASLFWILVMMSLGSMDTATRHDIPVAARTEP